MKQELQKITNVYGKYFQKSRSFLYPLLGIKKISDFPTTGTYMAVEGLIQIEDCKLICTYKKEESAEFKSYEEKMLLNNPLFSKMMDVKNYNLYVFDYQSFESDWFHVIMGKYSKLNPKLKKAIKDYYGEATGEYRYIETYLYPDRYYDLYATLLDVETSTIKAVGELCNPCDIDKETLKIPKEDLEML
jgi:hypothetical protein